MHKEKTMFGYCEFGNANLAAVKKRQLQPCCWSSFCLLSCCWLCNHTESVKIRYKFSWYIERGVNKWNLKPVKQLTDNKHFWLSCHIHSTFHLTIFQPILICFNPDMDLKLQQWCHSNCCSVEYVSSKMVIFNTYMLSGKIWSSSFTKLSFPKQ